MRLDNRRVFVIAKTCRIIPKRRCEQGEKCHGTRGGEERTEAHSLATQSGMDFMNEASQRRSERRGISDEQISDCVNNYEYRYTHRDDDTFCKRQSDGKLLKVTIRDQKVVNCFLTH